MRTIRRAIQVLTAVPIATLLPSQQAPPSLVSVSTPPGNSLIMPQVAEGDGTIHVTWVTGSSLIPSHLAYNRSTDAGRTWQSADSLLLPVAWTPAPHYRMAASGQLVCVSVATATALISRRSLDGGSTWHPPVTVASTGEPTGLALVALGLFVHRMWSVAGPGGGNQIFYDRSVDGGTTWLPSILLDSGASPYVSPELHILADGASVHAFWRGASYDVLYRSSSDLGVSWRPTMVVAVRQLRGYGVLLDGGVVHVAYKDNGPGPFPVFPIRVWLRRSLDSGATWLPAVQVGSYLYLGYQFHEVGVAVDGNQVVVAWTTPLTVHASVSADGGGSWTGPRTLNFARECWMPSQIRVVRRGPYVVAAWNYLWGHERLYLAGAGCNRSNDGGLSWRLPDVHLRGTGNREAIHPYVLQIDDSFPVVSMSEPGVDMSCALLSGYQPYGTGTPGAGSRTPTLKGTGVPTWANTCRIELANAVGGASVLLGATFAGPAQRVFGSTPVLIADPVFPFYLTASGSPGVPGAGSASKSFLIWGLSPPLLLGTRLNFQGFVLDPAAPDGFSASNALEMWVF